MKEVNYSLAANSPPASDDLKPSGKELGRHPGNVTSNTFFLFGGGGGGAAGVTHVIQPPERASWRRGKRVSQVRGVDGQERSEDMPKTTARQGRLAAWLQSGRAKASEAGGRQGQALSCLQKAFA